MAFTAKDVAALRAATGVGMMDCKKALEATDGNIDQAIEWLRKKGIAKAESRAGRAASEPPVNIPCSAQRRASTTRIEPRPQYPC